MYFIRFEVTGMMRGGKRFKPLKFSSFKTTSMINFIRVLSGVFKKMESAVC